MGFEGAKKGSTVKKQTVMGWRKAKMDFATSTEIATANGAIVLRQPQGDLTMPKGHESHDKFSVDGKAISAKSSYIACEECVEERDRGEGPLACYCCPIDPVVVGFRTEAGPICCPSGSHCGPSDQVMVELRTEAVPVSPPSPKKSNPSPSATENTGWTSWDWPCLCVHAHLGLLGQQGIIYDLGFKAWLQILSEHIGIELVLSSHSEPPLVSRLPAKVEIHVGSQ
ncbi:hypothetical protein NL676_039253 [Syzygium grande]|nr:hypothetical protein NL676_039253 [Syzygium grande]